MFAHLRKICTLLWAEFRVEGRDGGGRAGETFTEAGFATSDWTTCIGVTCVLSQLEKFRWERPINGSHDV